MHGHDEQLEADLAALADGGLAGHRRAEVEACVGADPAVACALERQRAALALLAAASVPAPLRLRLRLDELEAPRRRRLPAVALALAAAVLVALALAGAGPTVDDVLAVASRPAAAPAALDEPFAGVRFPRYAGWRATGTRRDRVGGREVRTVVYERGGLTIAYAIVAGPPLEGGGGLRALPGAVTWTRGGRTCVIAGPGVSAGVLARLAVW